MVVPAHVGLEHPNLIWLIGIGIVMFAVGLWVNLSRSTTDTVHDERAVERDTE
jgi:hypothetical protein